MRYDLSILISWRIKSVIIAYELKQQKRLKLARLINQFAELFEEYLQEEYGPEYGSALLSLVNQYDHENPSSAQIIPFTGERK